MPEMIELSTRIRLLFARHKGISERNMFGGICFFANGNMIGGPTGNGTLIIRVGPDTYQSTLEHRFAREMNFTGRPMKGFVYIDPLGIASDKKLMEWINQGLSYARSLPAK